MSARNLAAWLGTLALRPATFQPRPQTPFETKMYRAPGRPSWCSASTRWPIWSSAARFGPSARAAHQHEASCEPAPRKGGRKRRWKIGSSG